MADHEHDRFDALLRHVVHTAPMPQPPAGFARDMARQVHDHAEEAGIETWVIRIVLAIATIAVAGFAIPFATFAGIRITNLLGDAPWPLLLTMTIVFGGMKLAEVARPPFRMHSETQSSRG